MGSKRRKNQKKNDKSKYSSLSDHRKVKSKLVSPMNQLKSPVVQYTWDKDLLPEHLWIAFLFEIYEDKKALLIYDKFLDTIGDLANLELIGFVSEFEKINEEIRNKIITDFHELVVEAVITPFGEFLKLYPSSPMSWLIPKSEVNVEESTEHIENLEKCISSIFDGKNEKSGHIRTIPFRRVLKFGLIKFATDKINDYLELLPKYPNHLTETEINHVHQLTRLQMSMFFNLIAFKDQKLEWPKIFWNQNVKLSNCKPFNYDLVPSKDQTEEDKDKIIKLISKVNKNIDLAKVYLNNLIIDYDFDIYNSIKDEVNLGLFSRITRLYVILLDYPNLWTKDLGGIILRCLIDTVISFSYLIKFGTESEYEEFIKYGEGKEKLLLLHIQDTYTREQTLNNQDVKEIANALGGGFTPELIDINLSFWTSISARDMAKKQVLKNIIALFMIQLVQIYMEHGLV